MTTTTTMTTIAMTRVFKLWDLIENWFFCEDIKGIQGINDNDKKNNNNKDDNNVKDNKEDMVISALGLD